MSTFHPSVVKRPGEDTAIALRFDAMAAELEAIREASEQLGEGLKAHIERFNDYDHGYVQSFEELRQRGNDVIAACSSRVTFDEFEVYRENLGATIQSFGEELMGLDEEVRKQAKRTKQAMIATAVAYVLYFATAGYFFWTLA